MAVTAEENGNNQRNESFCDGTKLIKFWYRVGLILPTFVLPFLSKICVSNMFQSLRKRDSLHCSHYQSLQVCKFTFPVFDFPFVCEKWIRVCVCFHLRKVGDFHKIVPTFAHAFSLDKSYLVHFIVVCVFVWYFAFTLSLSPFVFFSFFPLKI